MKDKEVDPVGVKIIGFKEKEMHWGSFPYESQIFRGWDGGIGTVRVMLLEVCSSGVWDSTVESDIW